MKTKKYDPEDKFDWDVSGVTVKMSQCSRCKKNIDGKTCTAYGVIPDDYAIPSRNIKCAERDEEFEVDDY